jgi:uncharacterized protein
VETVSVGPVERSERISSLDVLRGFALLGILLMNIVGFGLYMSAYDDPTVAGGATGPNLWVWITMHVLAEGKMRCLFSMVFGASMVLLTTRAELRGAASSAADVYYRRTLWLMLFGIVHAYLLWAGDILYPYALCGLVLYPFRHMRPRNLLLIGGTLVVLQAGFTIVRGFGLRHTIELAHAAEQVEKQGGKPSDEQSEAKKEWEEKRTLAKPTPEALRKDAEGWRGNFFTVVKTRAKLVSRWHRAPYYSPWNWDVWSMMFIGMGLLKVGVFSAQRSRRFYWLMALAGYGIGITVNSVTAWQTVRTNFELTAHQFTFVTYDLGRLSVALGHLAVLMLLLQAGAMRWLLDRLGAVGQMAFSNYIFHSVVCSTIFCGYGFGLYGKLERYQLYYVVAGVWVFQLIATPIWLRHYRFGPLEWCWRSLTYWKRQPMKLQPKALPAAAMQAGTA